MAGMSDFSLTTRWLIPAPIDQVWDCLMATEHWSSWWRYVARVDNAADDDALGVDSVRRYLWRTCLPYSLALDLRVTKITPGRSFTVEVTGDLIGSGSCALAYQENEAATELLFVWNVSLAKAWMKRWTGIARPLFVWNHRRVMKSGEEGLTRHLAGR